MVRSTVLHHFRNYDSKTGGLNIEMTEEDQVIAKQLLRQLETITNDHEARLRFLERMIGFGIGGLALLGFVLDKII